MLTCAAWDFNSARYPVTSHFTAPKVSFNDGFNYGRSNVSGIICPSDMTEHLCNTSDYSYRFLSFWITKVSDPGTLDWEIMRTSLHDESELKLAFSDEFNNNGQTFYPCDNPFWEATDLHC